MRILFFCMGNICRSPTAEAVMRAKLKAAQIGVCSAEIQARAGASCGANLDAGEALGRPQQRAGNDEWPRKSPRPEGLNPEGGRSSVAPLVRGPTPDCASRLASPPFRVQRGPGFLPSRLLDHIEVDSAGTHGYHVGDPPDERSQAHAAKRGYDLSALRARKFTAADFEHFDLVLGMDDGNLREARRICPPEHRERLKLLMDFAPEAGSLIVPDPYYDGAAAFEQVLDLVEAACDGLVRSLQRA